jgi:hypothetical protein
MQPTESKGVDEVSDSTEVAVFEQSRSYKFFNENVKCILTTVELVSPN